MNPSDELYLVKALETLSLSDEMARSMVTHLSKLPLLDSYSLFKAFIHRTLKEYGVEPENTQNPKESILDSTGTIFVIYYAHHHGRRLFVSYVDVIPPTVTITEIGTSRCIAFMFECAESLTSVVEQARHPIQFSSTNEEHREDEEHREVSAFVLKVAQKLITFLEGKVTTISKGPTPGEPVFLTPTAPFRPYSLDFC